ncbi:MAG TPA: BNR repeat-containing protein [Phycisphaerae bacterium]|nr:BNR repeat-containing protein [Phycisphaerae bacterium]HRY70017.1 BNR repeat-containing protein [Phycisphaerae bacterium]HSA27226.1 BNR repeat-containing protein [Phycisphaerae bacterium]
MIPLVLILLVSFLPPFSAAAETGYKATPAEPVLEEDSELGPVWSGHPVGFCLLTHEDRQYVAFYDDQRRMTVAARRVHETPWQYTRLPQTLGWDSHNSIAMAVDNEGYLHLAGNMHCVPLICFRTERPHDIQTFQQVKQMVGREERRVTYPKFFQGPGGELIFTYRDGGSGAGNQILNVYDAGKRAWRRLLDAPLTHGQGEMNAYFDNLRRDQGGVYHLCWVWRDTPDCATNHDVCYARSRDLVHWERSDGGPLKVPITHKTCEIVDPVPVHGGLINGNARLGFDGQRRPVISYHKYDENGHTQVYNARLEEGGWKVRKVSDWDYRWEFSGGGSISFEIAVSPIEADAEGRLTQAFHHPRAGSGRWLLDAKTLTPVETLPPIRRAPLALGKVVSSIPGMQVRWAEDSGSSRQLGTYYLLRWETLSANRDRPREGTPPAPSMLRALKFRRSSE